MSEIEILSIQVGMPKTYDSALASEVGQDRSWESGIYKFGIDGPVYLSETNLEGDGQADLVHHGGPDRAVLLYSAEHYLAWENRFARPLSYGSFGENFTVSIADEKTVCIGDIWVAQDIEIEVSQPRLPCFKLARRLNMPGLNLEVVKNRKGGWYARTLKQGSVEAGQTLKLVERPNPEWTIDRAFEIYMTEKKNWQVLRELHDLPQLSTLWKESLMKRLEAR
ncbi:MAG: MOSC domain-containing protein [Armatimonadota bacterium]